MKVAAGPKLLICWIILASITYDYQCRAQETEMLDSVIEVDDLENLEDAMWLEKLWELKENPVNLNQASLQELLRIPFLSGQMADDIISFRDQGNRFKSSRDLYQIENITEELIEAIEPFVTFSSNFQIPSIIYRFQTRLENPLRSGFRDNIYHNPFYFQHRILFSSSYHISGGIIWEKDAGELNHFDFGSFHIRYQHPAGRFSFTAGDFFQKTGLGLITWSPFGKTLNTDLNNTNSRGMQQTEVNKSTQENGFYRGFAVEGLLNSALAVNVFISGKQLDATSSDESFEVSNLYLAGLHRTVNEIQKKGVLNEKVVGTSLELSLNEIEFQLSSVFVRYTPAFRPAGRVASYQSLSCCYNYNDFQVAGELALYNTEIPAIHCSVFHSSDQVKFEFDSYYYHPEYFATHARAPGSFQQTPSNKTGTITLVQYKINGRIRLGVLTHFNRSVHSSQQNPFVNRDYLLDLQLGLYHQKIRIQYRCKYRLSENMEFPLQETKKTDGIRLNHRIELGKRFRFENRIELRWSQPVNRTYRYYGIDFYQQMGFSSKKWKATVRWSVFDIPEYDLRIYEFENDLPGTIRSVLLNKNGYKFFILLQVKASTSLQLDIKYQQRFYTDTEEVGSGRDTFPAPLIHEYRLSLLLKL